MKIWLSSCLNIVATEQPHWHKAYKIEQKLGFDFATSRKY